jgi:transposase
METQSNKLDFTGQNIYVGFDVHKKNWRVSIMSEHLSHKTFSQSPKPDILYEYLVKNFPGATYHSAYEAGFCGYWIHNKLKSLGINSIVVNPADVPTTDKERDRKNDTCDSQKIARSLRNNELTPIYVPTLKTLEDRTLIRARSTLVKDLTRFKNRIKSFLFFHGIDIPDSLSSSSTHWSKHFIDWLENIKLTEISGTESLKLFVTIAKNLRISLLDITKQIRELSKTEDYKENVDLLRSVPGIGIITAMMILTELENIERFGNIDRLCGFIGFVPSTHSSGEKDNTGSITKRSHSVLRTALIESAWIAARKDPALMKCYNSYCKRMDANDAIIRIAKKLLSRISYVLKNKQPYVCAVIK